MTIPPPVPYAALMSSQDAFARPPGRWHRSVPAWPNWRIDVLPAVLIGAFQVGLTNVAGRHQVGHQQLDPLGGTLLAIGALALIGRRRWPVATLGVALAATLTFVVLDYPNGPIWLPLIFALYNVMIRGYRLVAWGTLVLGYAAFMWLPYLVGAEAKPPSIPGAVGIGAWLLVLGSAAEIARIRRERSLEAQRMHAEEARRRAGAQHLAHQRAGRCGAPPHRRAAGAGAHGPGRDQAGQQGGARRAALGAERAAAGRRRAAAARPGAQRRAPGRAGVARLGRRAEGPHRGLRHAQDPARGGRPGRLPDRPGGPHQRRQARRRGDRHHPDRVR